MMIQVFKVAVTLGAAGLTFGNAMAAGDAGRGETLYQGCQDCHSLDVNEVGPMHRGVFGRKAGSVADYAYSPALRNSGITWTAEALDHWLEYPSKLVPGTKMFFRLTNVKDRADVIEYLKERAK